MEWLRELTAVAGGGALGASSRHVLSRAVHELLGRDFPWGTLVVNTAGSLLLGLVYVILVERSLGETWWRPAIVAGFLGALTTFSTFSMDTMNLLEQGRVLVAGINILANVVICLAAAWVGLVVSRSLIIG